ncbi:MAG: hypothetical protein QOI66_3482, partial [Myxococcales bacterium]|nr:hypothetical protein [Myxococcales bacterium]
MTGLRRTLNFVVALAVAPTHGCLGPGDFICHTADDCGAAGFCEANGRCSLADTVCPSGRRYRQHAGATLSDQCVGDACPGNPLTALRVGAAHACLLLADGGVGCWGRNDHGQLGDGTLTPRSAPVAVNNLPPAKAIATGQQHTCAVARDGTVACWGGGPLAPTGPPAVVPGIADAVDVAAGSDFSCALLASGGVQCWGDNSAGQLGDGTGTPQAVPVTVFALTGVVTLSASGQHACALRDDQTVWCWGNNPLGQLGDGTIVNQPRPVRAVGLTSVVAVATSPGHSCAATRADGLWCWGSNDTGQLGTTGSDAANQPRPVRVAVVNDPIDVAAGAHHTCALRKNGGVWCWGNNRSGQLGEGTTGSLGVPVPVSTFTGGVSVAAGETFTCARKNDGTLWCWGDNRDGQLGLGSAIVRTTPVRVAGVSAATDVAAGGAHSCATGIGSDGATAGLLCWGSNRAGQLGDNTTLDRSLPAATKIPLAAIQVAAGTDHSCARTADDIFCWGRGNAGQLGPATLIDNPIPATVGLPAAAGSQRVSAGDRHTCAIAASKTVSCWGANDSGQLGDASVGGIPNVVDVAAGGAHTCALTSDGAVHCWGRNDDGQLGDGVGVGVGMIGSAPTGRSASGAPLATAAGALTATAIAAGASHSCAVDSDGRLWCWGRGADGQLGTGTNAGASRPTMVSAPATAITVSA